MLFLNIFNGAVEIYQLVLLIRVILSWVAPYSRNDFTNVVYALTDPILNRCKVVIPVGRGYMDLSVLIAWFGIKILVYIVNRLYWMI